MKLISILFLFACSHACAQLTGIDGMGPRWHPHHHPNYLDTCTGLYKWQISNMEPITKERLIARGWKLAGGSWYNGNKRLTNFDDKWQSWINGISKEILTMNEL